MAQQRQSQGKSFLSWVGGKARLAGKIIPLIPDHTCYCEVFAGAAWLLFKKSESKAEVVNDINVDLVTLYRVVQNHLDEFVRYFRWAIVARVRRAATRYSIGAADRARRVGELLVLNYRPGAGR